MDWMASCLHRDFAPLFRCFVICGAGVFQADPLPYIYMRFWVECGGGGFSQTEKERVTKDNCPVCLDCQLLIPERNKMEAAHAPFK